MEQPEFSHRVRKKNLDRLSRETFDVLVIGGGITGAGVARDAVLRGLRVALAERSDFGSGTSSKSSRLIHGGFRYLATGDFRLVFESCRERHILLRIAPRLVHPLEFVYPFYGSSRLGMVGRSAGLWLYDGLALFRNVRRHRMLGPRAASELEPALRREGMTGAALYGDCLTNDFRLTLATLLSAHRHGAVLIPYVEAMAARPPQAGLREVVLREAFSGETFCARARVVVNAAGPWLDEMRDRAGAGRPPSLQTSKGSHLVIPRQRVGHSRAIVFRAVTDQRVLLAIPFGPLTLIGTTEVHPRASPGEFSDREEAAYLLDSANAIFPEARLKLDDVWCTYSGLRPLLRSHRGSLTAASREHEVFEDPDGLMSVGGGKLTTYRAMAEEVVDRVARRLGRRPGRCRTADMPLDEEGACPRPDTDAEGFQGPRDRYGPGCRIVEELAASDPRWASSLVPGLPYRRADVRYAVEHEMAMTLEDVLVRRVPLFYEDRGHGLACASEVAEVLGDALGWGPQAREEQARRYQDLARQSVPQ
ncbi:MAG: glycerol-3-phosphate dehydrogenase/oxidase [Planctomycetes bacterium]|nr:glycerol-3-phosphate dehydrogenase/oxidase [Planctomycetota bacterium]